VRRLLVEEVAGEDRVERDAEGIVEKVVRTEAEAAMTHPEMVIILLRHCHENRAAVAMIVNFAIPRQEMMVL
jgi:hypothetical protein